MWRRLAAIAVTAVLAGACVGPSRTDADYRNKAANAAESMLSAVETARLVVETDARGSSTARYTSLVLSESEDAASSVALSFEVVQPPSRAAVALREQVTGVFDEVTSTLSDLRIAARAGRHAELPAFAEPLAGLRRALLDLTRLAPT